MTTTEFCRQCDMHGPELPSLHADAVELHRSAHDLWRVTVEPWALPVVRWLARTFSRS